MIRNYAENNRLSRKVKILMIAVGCAAALSACTKSNIVQPETAPEPDFNMYNNIELDEEQLQADVEDVWLDESEFPMGAAFEFEIDEDTEAVDMSVVVKDGTSPEDASWYADQVVKGFNDQVAMQDFSYGQAEDDSFGGYFQDRELHLKIYEESQYEADGEPMYEVTVPADTYMTFDIE